MLTFIGPGRVRADGVLIDAEQRHGYEGAWEMSEAGDEEEIYGFLTITAQPQDSIAQGQSGGRLDGRLEQEVNVEMPLSVAALDDRLEVGLGRGFGGTGDHFFGFNFGIMC